MIPPLAEQLLELGEADAVLLGNRRGVAAPLRGAGPYTESSALLAGCHIQLDLGHQAADPRIPIGVRIDLIGSFRQVVQVGHIDGARAEQTQPPHDGHRARRSSKLPARKKEVGMDGARGVNPTQAT